MADWSHWTATTAKAGARAVAAIRAAGSILVRV